MPPKHMPPPSDSAPERSELTPLKQRQCDGQRPVCGKCRVTNTYCEWFSGPGMTRNAALKHRNERLEGRVSAMLEIYWRLQNAPPNEATELLNRIRAGAEPDAVLTFENEQEGPVDLELPPALSSSVTATSMTLAPALNNPTATKTGQSEISKANEDWIIQIMSLPSTLFAIKVAIDRFHACTGIMFPVISREKSQQLQHDVLEPLLEHGVSWIFQEANDYEKLARIAALSELCGMAAVGLQFNHDTLPVLPMDSDKDLTEHSTPLYQLGKHFLDEAIKFNPFGAMRTCSFLAMFNIVDHSTVALAYCGNNDEKLIHQKPPASLDVEGLIQERMTFVTILKAGMLRALSFRALSLPLLRSFRAQLLSWHADLPPFMRLENVNADNVFTEDQRRVLFFMHIFYLSAILLKARIVRSTQLETVHSPSPEMRKAVSNSEEACKAIKDGLDASRSIARLMGILMSRDGVFKKCWLCIFSSYMAFNYLALGVIKAVAAGFSRDDCTPDIDLAKQCLDLLELCASADNVARKFHAQASEIYKVMVGHEYHERGDIPSSTSFTSTFSSTSTFIHYDALGTSSSTTTAPPFPSNSNSKSDSRDETLFSSTPFTSPFYGSIDQLHKILCHSFRDLYGEPAADAAEGTQPQAMGGTLTNAEEIRVQDSISGGRCIYDVAENETRMSALKRKHKDLEKDNTDFQELLHALQCRSEPEAIAILRRLRSKQDPSSVLQHVKEGDVLLQASRGSLSDTSNKDNVQTNTDPPDYLAPDRSDFTVTGPNARNLMLHDRGIEKDFHHTDDSVNQLKSSYVRDDERNLVPSNRNPEDSFRGASDGSTGLRRLRSLRNAVETLEQLYHYIQVMPEAQLFGGKDNDERLRLLDVVALDESDIKVLARPWTTVAGNGIVSQLISVFFHHYQPIIMPFINRQAFVADMATGQIGSASTCSPVLVNAISAYAAINSQHVWAVNKACRGKLQERFWDEARKLLEREFGKNSLTTMRLCTFSMDTHRSKEWSAQVQYFALREPKCTADLDSIRIQLARKSSSLKMTNSESRFHKPRGVYFGSIGKSIIFSLRFRVDVLILHSIIASLYQETPLISTPQVPRHFAERNRRYMEPVAYAATSEDLLNMQSDIAEVYARILTHRSEVASRPGDEADAETRKQLFDDLSQLGDTLHTWIIVELNLQRLNIILQGMLHLGVIIVYGDLLGLRPVTKLSEDSQTPAEICLEHCRSLLRQVRILDQMRPFEVESNVIMTVYFCYFLLFKLMPLFSIHRESQDLFVHACAFMYKYIDHTPLVVTMFSGAKTFSQRLGIRLPADALGYLNAGRELSQRKDVPVSWNIPSPIKSESEDLNEDLGIMVVRWSAMTIAP
ncbi:MAG: hypothetical protein Q9191_004266 [Dirinaria sp. TL-2023a]